MSGTPFGHDYANLYDATYRSKDYSAETELLEAAFARFGDKPTESILDLGCGTGNHAVALASRGYRVAGVDRSPEMLEFARQKSAEKGLEIEWCESDIRDFSLGRQFDAVILMFAVFSYLTTNEDILATLRRIRTHLRDGGLLAFDFWYGPAVLVQQPELRVAEIQTPEGPVKRTVIPRLNERHQQCEITYRLEKPGQSGHTEERHVMRFLFPMELELLLDIAGFEIRSLTAFPTLDRPADAGTWSAFCVAAARPEHTQPTRE